MFHKVRLSLQNRLQYAIEVSCYNYLGLEWNIRSKLPVKIRSSAEWAIYNDIFVDREYDAAIEQALKSSTNLQAFEILDLGANVGFFILRCASLISDYNLSQSDFKVVAVEGSLKNFNELDARLKDADFRSGFPTVDTNLIHGLVGNLDGEGFIEEFDFHVMNAVTLNPSKKGRKVPYINLNKIYGDVKSIDLLKCDIEGSELTFINNYQNLLSKTNVAVFEMHHNQCDTDKCVEILHSCGLELCQTLKQGSDFSLQYFTRL